VGCGFGDGDFVGFLFIPQTGVDEPDQRAVMFTEQAGQGRRTDLLPAGIIGLRCRVQRLEWFHSGAPIAYRRYSDFPFSLLRASADFLNFSMRFDGTCVPWFFSCSLSKTGAVEFPFTIMHSQHPDI
jgi:hypothetical protein